MPRCFLNVRYKDGPHGLAMHEEGDALPDVQALRVRLLETARDLIVRTCSKLIPDWSVCVLAVTDKTGSRVFTLPFREGLEP